MKVQQHIADRVSIWIPSRQEEVWVRVEKLKKLEQAAKPKVTPTEEAKPRAPGKLKYFADSPEFLTQTVDAIGYREKLDKTFQEAIARVKGLR